MKATLTGLTDAWNNLAETQKTMLMFAAAIFIVIVYLGVFWRETYAKRSDLEYQLAKQTRRNRHTTSIPPGKTLKNQPELSRAPHLLEQDLARLNAQIKEAKSENERLKRAFLDLDRPEMLKDLQTLKVGITRLAESGDMEVQRLEHVLASETDREKPFTTEILKNAAAKNAYQRPLLRLKARASYRGLMQFLHGLDSLPFVAAPVKNSITIGHDSSSQRKTSWLNIELELAI